MSNKNKQIEKPAAAVKAAAAGIKEKAKRRIAKIKPVKPVKSDANKTTLTDNRLELLITVVNRTKGEYYIDLIQSFDVNMQFVTLGNGTADARMLSRFGLSDNEKTVIFSVIQSGKIPHALAALDEKFRTIKNGKGIAYTVPMTSVIGTLIFGFLSNNKQAVKESRK